MNKETRITKTQLQMILNKDYEHFAANPCKLFM